MSSMGRSETALLFLLSDELIYFFCALFLCFISVHCPRHVDVSHSSTGQMRSTLLSMMAQATLKCCEGTNTCHTPLLSLYMVVKCIGLTGAQIPWPRPTSGQATMSLLCREPTHSPLTCRSTIPLANL